MNNQHIQTQVRSLTQILDDLKTGDIQIPPFQRDFVWGKQEIKNLFDSVQKNYPIGSILLWSPAEMQTWKGMRDIGSFNLPNTNTPKAYVLDGYQRLSSLFGCLTDPDKSGLTCDFKKRKELFNLYFDLKRNDFIYPIGTPQPYQVPVYKLTSTSEFRQYTRNVLEPAIGDSVEFDTYLNNADAFSRRLVDYKLAVIEVEKSSLNDAVEIFSRINSKGMEISYDYMVSALSFSNTFNFALKIDNLLEDLDKYNFSNIQRITLFRCYQSAFDNKLYIDTDIESLAKHPDFPETIDKMSVAINRAVKFLFEEINVVDGRLLPYTAQLVFLAVFFMKVGSPTEKQFNDLKKWFFVTTYTNYFTTHSLSGQRKAFNTFLQYVSGLKQEPIYWESPEDEKKIQPWPKTLRLASVRGIALVLFQLNKLAEMGKFNLDGKKLYIGKIFQNEESTPENMKVLFAGKTPQQYFFPCGENNAPQQELENRKEKLQAEEKLFVEKLGLRYTT